MPVLQPTPVLADAGLLLCCPSPADTMAAGAALAPLLRAGDTVLLGGELGAGKTTFTKGLARELGVREEVTSPTFVLVHTYPTDAGWDLLHADVWRLAQLQEVIDLAIPEAQEDGAVAVVEWGDRAAPALSPDHLYVTFSFDDGSDQPDGTGAGPKGVRCLTFQAYGARWAVRAEALHDLVGRL